MQQLRSHIYNLLNPDDHRSRLSNGINFFIIALILINVASAALETVDEYSAAYSPVFFFIEIFSVSMFTLEYALRFWSCLENKNCTSRRQFLFSFDSVIDLLAIVPFYVGYFFGIDVRTLIGLRLFRLLKLVRYFQPLAIMSAVVKAEFRSFMAAMLVLLILVFIAATGIYFFEKEAQPDVFGNIPQSMWWAIVTLTTLGYGDVIPVTIGGRLFAALMTILSIGTVALPAGMLASRFSEEMKKRKDDFSDKISVLMADGTLSEVDLRELEEHREALCLSGDDAEKIITQSEQGGKRCPTCGRA